MSINKPVVDVVVVDDALLLWVVALFGVGEAVALELTVDVVFAGKQLRFGFEFKRTLDTSAHNTLPFFVNLVTNWSMFIASYADALLLFALLPGVAMWGVEFTVANRDVEAVEVRVLLLLLLLVLTGLTCFTVNRMLCVLSFKVFGWLGWMSTVR